MARGVNKVILIGNLGNDPEVRFMPNGQAVANLSIATSESWKDKDSGEKRDHTEWHRIVLYRRLAEIAGEYLKRGSKVYLEGKLRTRKWADQNGQDRYSTEVIADELQMLDRAGEGAPTSNYNSTPRQAPASAPQAQQPAPATSEFDDDIPF